MAMSLSYGTTDYIEGGVITAVIVRISPLSSQAKLS